jgi:TetR/AcrR family transcriptional regulator, transcriptional repressor for nem operon
MNKGEQTREGIIQKAINLFNTKGYAASSIADIMEATGLQKGGIYNHFSSKDELSLAAFDYGSEVIGRRLTTAVKGETNAIAKLTALINVFRMYSDNPPFPGGCIMMNAAIESDYGNPSLQAKARKEMDDFRRLIRYVVDEGIKRRQIKPSINSDFIATNVISTLEGSVMLTSLYRDPTHIERTLHFLEEFIRRELAISNS